MIFVNEKMNVLKGEIKMATKNRDFEKTAKITSNRLSTLFKSQGIKAYKVAQKLGIATGTVYNWISGARVPQLSVLIKLARLYNVSIDWILGLSNKPYLDNDDSKKQNCYIDLDDDKTFQVSYKGKPVSEELNVSVNGLFQGIIDIEKGNVKLTNNNIKESKPDQ